MMKEPIGETRDGELPEPSVAAWEILHQAATQLPGQENPELHTQLDDIYKELESTERPLIRALSELQDAGKISADDKLFLVVAFAMAGPDENELGIIHDAIASRRFPIENLNDLASRIDLPDAVKDKVMDLVIAIQHA